MSMAWHGRRFESCQIEIIFLCVQSKAANSGRQRRRDGRACCGAFKRCIATCSVHATTFRGVFNVLTNQSRPLKGKYARKDDTDGNLFENKVTISTISFYMYSFCDHSVSLRICVLFDITALIMVT